MTNNKWKKFMISELFYAQNGDVDIKRKDINGRCHPVITSGRENFGIAGLSDISAKIFDAGTITVDMFGNAYYRDFMYKMVTHARVFSIKLINNMQMNYKTGLFIVSSLSFLRSIFSFDKMCTFDKIKNFNINIPVKEHDAIDWEYIESFMNDIEQDVIRERIDRIEKIRQVIDIV